MPFNTFPAARAGVNLLTALAQQLVSSVQTLSEMLGASVAEYPRLEQEISDFDTESTALQHTLLTELRSTYLSPVPREELYEVSNTLAEAMERIAGAAALLKLYQLDKIPSRASDQLEILLRQAELTVAVMPQLDNLDALEDYWLEMLQLSKRAEGTHRAYAAELLKLTNLANYHRHRDFAKYLVAASRCFRLIAVQISTIIIKES